MPEIGEIKHASELQRKGTDKYIWSACINCGKEVDHKKPLSKGGSNSKSNTRITTRSVNRKKYDK